MTKPLRVIVGIVMVSLIVSGRQLSQAALPPGKPDTRQQTPERAGNSDASRRRTPNHHSRQGRGKPHFISGQLIVKFKSDGEHAVLECAHCLLRQHKPFRAATADRSDSLDRLHERFKVKGARLLFEKFDGVSTAEAKQRIKQLFDTVTQKYAKRANRVHQQTEPPDLTNVVVLEMDPQSSPVQVALEYAKDPHVEFAEPNYLMETSLFFNDQYYQSSNTWNQGYRDLWGLDMLDVEHAWPISQGEGTIVAVVDTGLDYTHPDIATNAWTNAKEIPGNGIDDDGNGYVDDVRGWDFTTCIRLNPDGSCPSPKTPDNDPIDGNGHGTHVAGTIAASGGNGLGIVGVAPKAKIMPLKGLDDGGSGGIQGLSEAIVYATNNGADVINNSWGPTVPGPTPQVLRLAVEYANATGVVVVAAAGNSNDDVENGYYPASLPQVIGVGAVDHNGWKSDFSNHGQKLDIMAPGGDSASSSPNRSYQNILSLRAGTTDLYGDGVDIVGTSYYRARGTSMAAPHISGVAALLLAAQPSMTMIQLKKRLYGNAYRFGAGLVGFNRTYGFGIAKASAALADNQDYILARITQPHSGLLFGQRITISGIAAAKSFSHYEILVGQGSSPTSWQMTGITLTGGEIIEGPLATWDTSGLANGFWTVRLVVYDTTGRNLEQTVLVTVDNSLKPGWPQQVLFGGASYNASIAVGDLDGDGKLEVVSGSYEGLLYAWHFDGTPVEGFPVYVGGYDGQALTPTLGDVDGDGKLEIAVGANSTHPFGIFSPDLHLLRFDGTPMPGWPKISANFISDAVVMADLDGDGTLELIVGEEDRKVHAYHYDGTPVAGWPVNIQDNQNVSAVAVGDLDGDGKPEVVAVEDTVCGVTCHGKLYAWHSDGTPVAGWPVEVGGGLYQPVLADLDGDGRLEVIVSGRSTLAVLHADGTAMPGWPKALAGGLPCVGDLNGDGKPELVVAGASDDSVYVFQADGSALPGWPRRFGFHNPAWISACTIGDVDGDGYNDIVLPAYDSWGGNYYLYALHADRGLIPGWPKLNADYFSSPVLTDLDQDGRAEVIAIAPPRGSVGVNVYVWDLNRTYDPAKMDWPMLGQNAKHTSIFRQPPRNHPPVLNTIGDRVVAEGDLLTFILSATDPDKDPLSFSASNLPPGAIFDLQTATFTWTPTAIQAGTYPNVHFEVSDGQLTDAKDITITVKEASLALAGTIRDQAGHPVSGVSVKLSGLGRYPGHRSIEALTDAQGYYVLSELQTTQRIQEALTTCQQAGVCLPIRAVVRPRQTRMRFVDPHSTLRRSSITVIFDPKNLHDATGIDFTATSR